MAQIIEAAREHDGQLRGILSDPKLLRAVPRSGIGKLYPDTGSAEVKNIAKGANAYCRKFWGHGIKDVIFKRCPEPLTGEVTEDSYSMVSPIRPPHIYKEAVLRVA